MAISFVLSGSSMKTYALIKICTLINLHLYTHHDKKDNSYIYSFFFLLLKVIFRDKGTVIEKWSIYICEHVGVKMSCKPSMYGFKFIWKREGCLFWFQLMSSVQKWNTINPQQQQHHEYNLYVNVNVAVTPSLAVDISDSGQQTYVVES